LTAAPRWGGFGVALLISTLLTVLWALPLVTHAGTRVLGGPSDATSTIRDYWYAEHVGSSPFSLRRDTLIAAPEGITRSPGIQVANAVQPLAILALKRAVGLVAAWNIFLLAGIALTAACTWLLLDCLGVGAVASFFGAYAFGLSGYLVNKAYAGHAGLVHAWVFPLLFLTLLRWRDHGRALAAAVAGAIAALAFYIHSYYGFFATFLIAAFFVYTAVADRRRLPPRRIARDGALTLATLVALLLPALVAMHLLRSVDTPPGTHSADSLQRFGAKIPAYVAPSSWSPLGHLVPHSLAARLKDSAEPSLFFGFSTLVLAALFVWLTLRGRAQQRSFLAGFCAVLVVAAFLASLPRLLTIGPVSLPMPSWFVAHVTTVWRVYARFGVLVGLGLVVLAALTVDQLSRRNRLAGLACVVVLVLELTPSLPAKTWVANDPPPADRWLAAHPGGIAAIYPLTGDIEQTSDLNVAEYYFQRFHAHPLYSAVVSSMDKTALAFRSLSQYFTEEDTTRILQGEHVRYVVLRDDVYRAIGQQPPKPPRSDYTLVARLPGARVYRLRRRAFDLRRYVATHGAQIAAGEGQQPPADHFGTGFYGPETYKFYGTPWRWMSQDAQIAVEPDPLVTHVTFETLAFANGAPRTLSLRSSDGRVLGTARIETSIVTIKFGPFAIRGGSRTTYTLHVDPGPAPLGPGDQRVASVYLNQPVFRPIVVDGR